MPKNISSPKTKAKLLKGRYSIGIDLGGTKVSAALVDREGRILGQSTKPTVPPWMKDMDPRTAQKLPSAAHVRKHVDYVIGAMADAALEASSSLANGKRGGRGNEILGVGLASAGPMDVERGTLDYPSNFVGWKKVAIVELLEKALAERGLNKRVAFQNDAIAAALGEGWIGRAKGCSTYAMITVGTGIGSGVIFNGQPCQSRGMGSEWGHLLAHAPGISDEPENFYERSVEGLSSGTGLIRRAKARGFKGESAADLAVAARKGDKLALEMFKGCSEGLAALMYSLSLGFHPDKFVVSGGMLAIRDLYLPQAISLYRDLIKRKNPLFLAPVQVAKLGVQAGVIGAARLPLLSV